MNEEFNNDDRLWQLLGKARPAQPRGSLAQDVIRSIRQDAASTEPAAPWYPILRWFLPPFAAASIAACMLLSFSAASTHPDLTFEDAAELDTLIASSAGWTWAEVAP